MPVIMKNKGLYYLVRVLYLPLWGLFMVLNGGNMRVRIEISRDLGGRG